MSSYQARYSASEPERSAIDAQPGLALLEFGAPWCGHCLAAQPAIQSLLLSNDDAIRHIKVEDGPGQPLGRSFKVKLWPTLVLLRDGEEIARVVRPGPTSDLEELKSALVSA